MQEKTLIAERLVSYSFSKSSLPTPHQGQIKSSGKSSNFVPGAMPCSGQPSSSS